MYIFIKKKKKNFIFAHKSLKFYGDDITSLNFKLYKFKNLCIT